MTRTILLFTMARSAMGTRSVCRASGFVQVGLADNGGPERLPPLSDNAVFRPQSPFWSLCPGQQRLL